MTKSNDRTFSRRLLLLAGASVPLGGCQPFGTDYSTLKDAVGVSLGFKAPPGVTLAEAAAVPFASIAFRIGSAGEAMLVLASANGQNLLWTSSQRVAITTNNGRIVTTAGFRWNLSSTAFVQADPLQHMHKNSPGGTLERLLDFGDVKRFAVRVSSRFQRANDETITILGNALETTRFLEDCSCPELEWQYQNQYWVDRDTGFLWKSRQSVHPNLPPISISVLRPSI